MFPLVWARGELHVVERANINSAHLIQNTIIHVSNITRNLTTSQKNKTTIVMLYQKHCCHQQLNRHLRSSGQAFYLPCGVSTRNFKISERETTPTTWCCSFTITSRCTCSGIDIKLAATLPKLNLCKSSW